MEEIIIKVISQDILLKEFRSIIREELAGHNKIEKYYSINKVSKLLCVGHNRINTLVQKGILSTNAFGHISSVEVDKLMNDSNFKMKHVKS